MCHTLTVEMLCELPCVAGIMVKHLIRLLLHSFFKEKDFYSSKRPIIKNLTRILPVLNHKSRKPRLNFFSHRRILIETKMPKVKSGFYAVHIGFKPGVYHSWEECEKQIKKYPNAKYKKFNTLQEAEAFVKEGNNKKVFGNSTRETPISKYISSKQQNTSSSASNVSNEKSLKVWTDGSSINNGQHGAKAGIGVYWGKDDPRNISERLPGPRQTNNRAEIMAVIRALETCPDNNIPLEIRTDSQYVINAYKSWIPKWEKNNKWKTSTNKDVENKELFQRLMKLVRARNAEVTIEYVQGHVGVQENEEADQLAKLGAFMDTVDDLYDYDDDETEIKRQHTILQYFQTITDESSPPSIVENSQILLNNFEYNKNILAKDDSN